MIPGIQTHIEEWTPPTRLREVYALGYRLARIAAMDCSVEVMLQNVRDAREAGLTPVVTIADPERIRHFQPGDFIECRNEDDGDISPEEYRRILDEMAAISLEVGTRLWGGVGSNTDDDTLKWGNEVRDCGGGWPTGMFGLSWHSYGPYPHDGFTAREGQHRAFGECEWLLALANGLPILMSEFGDANTTGVTEEQQAAVINDLWRLWEQIGLWGACLFQIHDGPDAMQYEHRFGIYRCDDKGQVGGLKPVAFVVPQPLRQAIPVGERDMTIIGATFSISRSKQIPSPHAAGCFASQVSDTEVLSVQPDGRVETRPIDQIGPWETYREEGTRAVFFDVDGKAFAIPLVD